MELWQGIAAIIGTLLYLVMTVMIFFFTWGRLYNDTPQPPSWHCGFLKLILVSCIINATVGSCVLFASFYFTIGVAVKG